VVNVKLQVLKKNDFVGIERALISVDKERGMKYIILKYLLKSILILPSIWRESKNVQVSVTNALIQCTLIVIMVRTLLSVTTK